MKLKCSTSAKEWAARGSRARAKAKVRAATGVAAAVETTRAAPEPAAEQAEEAQEGEGQVAASTAVVGEEGVSDLDPRQGPPSVWHIQAAGRAAPERWRAPAPSELPTPHGQAAGRQRPPRRGGRRAGVAKEGEEAEAAAGGDWEVVCGSGGRSRPKLPDGSTQRPPSSAVSTDA